MTQSFLHPPAYAVVSAGIMLAMDCGFDAPFALADQLVYPSILLSAGGATLLVWSAGLFYLSGTTLHPQRTARRLVTKGPYQFSRNPLYLGLLMLLTGLAFGLASLPACLVLPGFFLALQLEFVDAEEIHLQQRFGQHYLHYREQVPRWL